MHPWVHLRQWPDLTIFFCSYLYLNDYTQTLAFTCPLPFGVSDYATYRMAEVRVSSLVFVLNSARDSILRTQVYIKV